jgi:hypothetical protein
LIALGVLACEGTPQADSPAPKTEPQAAGGSAPEEMASAAPSAGPLPTAAELPSENIVRRLTNEQYGFVAADVLGVELTSQQLNLLPADYALQGFSNIGSSQVALPEHASGYALLAEQLASQVDLQRYFAAHSPSFVPCQTPEAQCLSDHAAALLPSLFRRPPDAEELADYTALMQRVLDAGGTLDRAVRAALELALQAPPFLYLIENENGDGLSKLKSLDDYELASRLSFALWGSAPDGPLLAAAQTGVLRAEVGAQAARLLADPRRAERVTRRFLLDWLGIDKIADQPERTERIEGAVQLFQQHLWKDAQPLMGIYQKQQLVLTPAMAANHGFTPLGEGLASYSTAGFGGRLGLLAQPGVIASMDQSDAGAIVNRGLFILQRIFCADVDVNPPEALRGAIESFAESFPEDASDRAIASERLTKPECQGCHSMFDPLAFAFEQFDARGNFRTADEHGNALTTNGWVPVLAAGEMLPFNTLEEFTQHLVNSEVAQQCITRKMIEYFIGKRLHSAHKPVVAAVHQHFVAAGETYPALVQAIAASDVFTKLVPSSGGQP